VTDITARTASIDMLGRRQHLEAESVGRCLVSVLSLRREVIQEARKTS